MKTIIGFPPNYEKIAQVFDIKDKPVVFTYGDALYDPQGGVISVDLMVHELTHHVQQADNPEAWWDKYLEDKEFRLAQEIEAYRNQYKYLFSTTKDRGRHFKFGMKLAGDLSSEIYGRIIGKLEAYSKITAWKAS